MNLNLSPKRSVLVTGASEYIGLHVINILLKAGHRVRGTIKSMKEQTLIYSLACNPDKLELVESDLSDNESWKKAVEDMEIVIHCAYENPILAKLHSEEKTYDEESLIQQAVQGTREIFNACLDTTVKRVVVTMCNDMTLSLIELDIVKPKLSL